MILTSSELHRNEPELIERLWTACADAVYSLEPRERQLGLGEEVSNAMGTLLVVGGERDLFIRLSTLCSGHHHLLL